MSHNIVWKTHSEKDSNYSGKCEVRKREVFSHFFSKLNFLVERGLLLRDLLKMERIQARVHIYIIYIYISRCEIYARRACACLKNSSFYPFAPGRADGIYRWSCDEAVFVSRLLRYPTSAISEYARRTIWTLVFSRFLITVNLAGPLMLLAFNACTICARCEFAKIVDFFFRIFAIPHLNPCHRNLR